MIFRGAGDSGVSIPAELSDESQFPVPADQFALIPAGSFTIGDGHDGYSNAPEHQVQISSFYMGKHEVSWSLWQEVRDWAVSNGYSDLSAVGSGKADDHPVHTVTWYDAVKWCNAASERAGLDPVYYVSKGGAVYRSGENVSYIDYTKQGYRLPTEAEWEKAARGSFNGKRFPWGDVISHSEANYRRSRHSYSYDVSSDHGFHPIYSNDVSPYTAPVGSFAANGYGLYDMAGNVYEWCNDWYNKSYYSRSPAADPTGPSSGSWRIFRGGSWHTWARMCRVANRNCKRPSHSTHSSGFRLARSQ